MPAWASNSAGVPEVGITRTASVTIRGRELLSANTSSTTSPDPALGVVVLDGDDHARRLGRFDQGLLVDRLDPVIEQPTDIVVRVETSTICGTRTKSCRSGYDRVDGDDGDE